MEFVSSLFRKSEAPPKYEEIPQQEPVPVPIYSDQQTEMITVNKVDEKKQSILTKEEITDKKKLIEKLCGDTTEHSDQIKNLITEIKNKIFPLEYENYILTAYKNNRDRICQELLDINLYPLDTDVLAYVMVLSCETGNIPLFEITYSMIKRTTQIKNINACLLVAIKNNQHDMVSYFLSTATDGIWTNNHPSIYPLDLVQLGKKWNTYVFDKFDINGKKEFITWKTQTMDLLLAHDKKLMVEAKHPILMALDLPSMDIFRTLLKYFASVDKKQQSGTQPLNIVVVSGTDNSYDLALHITPVIEWIIIRKMFEFGKVSDIRYIQECGIMTTYNKKYFEITTNEEILDYLIEYFQNKQV
jgi:hypothetical protein